MRKTQKTQIEQTLTLMGKVHEEIRKQMTEGRKENVLQLLNDCQEGAIQTGNLIEQAEGEDAPSIQPIEEYCETCYRIYESVLQDEAQNPSGVYCLLQKALAAMDSSVRLTVPVRLEIAFFCYKASMSDCLESIYFAAKEDPSCDAYFIPIPYYDRYPNGAFGEMHYEGKGCYPDTYELMDWQEYNVEARRPDIIYIMNPYDRQNMVTSVHPAYYVQRLRKLTDCLVYVPYYVSAGKAGPGMTGGTPGVRFSDLMFVQSEQIRDACVEDFLKFNSAEGVTLKTAKEKIISMGSPKLDKLVNSRKEDYPLPAEWKKLVIDSRKEGKKIVLYNLTILGALNVEGDDWKVYLRKIKKVFEFFRNSQDVLVWFRPHPLLLQTLRSILPHFVKEYEEIIQGYINEGYGIYDDTADMDRALMWVDACYGDSSSVELLLEFLGKPVLIQNVENVGEESISVGSAEDMRKAMDIFTGKERRLNYVMLETKEEVEWEAAEDQCCMEDFFRYLDVILEYRERQLEKTRRKYANPDGTAGRKIHEYTKEFLRKGRSE